MSLGIGDNFNYSGRKPNFSRDSYETLAALRAVRDSDVDDGHLAYCAEDRRTYKFGSFNTVDSRMGKWRVFSGSTVYEVPELKSDYVIQDNPSTTSEDIYYIRIGNDVYTISGSASIKWHNGKAPIAEANCIVFISVINNLAVWGIFK